MIKSSILTQHFIAPRSDNKIFFFKIPHMLGRVPSISLLALTLNVISPNSISKLNSYITSYECVLCSLLLFLPLHYSVSMFMPYSILQQGKGKKKLNFCIENAVKNWRGVGVYFDLVENIFCMFDNIFFSFATRALNEIICRSPNKRRFFVFLFL